MLNLGTPTAFSSNLYVEMARLAARLPSDLEAPHPFQVSDIILPPAEPPPPEYRNTKHLPKSASHHLQQTLSLFGTPSEELEERRRVNHAALQTLKTSLNCVSLEEFRALESGKRLGSSGKNILHIPEGKAANYDIGRLHETGMIVFVNGIPLTGQAGVEGYVRTISDFYGRPVLVIVNDENSLHRGMSDPRAQKKPKSFINIPASVAAGALGHLSSNLGAWAEPCTKTLSRAYSEICLLGFQNNLSLAHSQGCGITSNALLQTKRNTPHIFRRMGNQFEVEAVARVETQWPSDIRIQSWGYSGDLLMRVGDGSGKVVMHFQKERHSEVASTIRLPGKSHDFDECMISGKARLLLLQAQANGCTPEAGRDFAFQVIEGLSRAQFGDRLYDQLFREIASSLEDPKSGKFSRSFASHMRMFCPDGRSGKYSIPREDWHKLTAR